MPRNNKISGDLAVTGAIKKARKKGISTAKSAAVPAVKQTKSAAVPAVKQTKSAAVPAVKQTKSAAVPGTKKTRRVDNPASRLESQLNEVTKNSRKARKAKKPTNLNKPESFNGLLDQMGKDFSSASIPKGRKKRKKKRKKLPRGEHGIPKTGTADYKSQ